MYTLLRLPLPRFATHWLFYAGLAVVHAYLGGGHLIQLAAGQLAWTHVWKGFGAVFGGYYFAALALRSYRGVWVARAPRRGTVVGS